MGGGTAFLCCPLNVSKCEMPDHLDGKDYTIKVDL
jgi:hypothetical protein